MLLGSKIAQKSVQATATRQPATSPRAPTAYLPAQPQRFNLGCNNRCSNRCNYGNSRRRKSPLNNWRAGGWTGGGLGRCCFRCCCLLVACAITWSHLADHDVPRSKRYQPVAWREALLHSKMRARCCRVVVQGTRPVPLNKVV